MIWLQVVILSWILFLVQNEIRQNKFAAGSRISGLMNYGWETRASTERNSKNANWSSKRQCKKTRTEKGALRKRQNEKNTKYYMEKMRARNTIVAYRKKGAKSCFIRINTKQRLRLFSVHPFRNHYRQPSQRLWLLFAGRSRAVTLHQHKQ